MDDIDREILSLLRRDGRASFRDLGAAVGLSANAAADRVRRLRREGVIVGFTTIVDPVAAGPAIEAVIDALLRRLKRECGAADTETRIVLRTALRRGQPVA